ncbi:SIR2 family protein, partial [Chitinophaga sp.]|uniref:SIR2 family NAD-dependent protein deacylase n=1 Tax=Chitinophaga sp. TaxID=1869181 RepID=UPI002F949A8C
MADFEIPKYLIDQIREGNVVLFLGSGFSYGATHPQKKKAPVGQGLADLMAEKFLGEEYKGDSLKNISKFAISEAGIYEVQEFVYDIFEPFQPASFHIQLANFKWKSIYTTNYDFIIERIYKDAPLQQITPVFRSTKDFMIFRHPNTLPYYKLHGCLSNINDELVPLVLTPEQYNTHRHNREMLFSKFFSEAWNHTVLFVGFSFADDDITTILEEIDSKVGGRPRFYFVGPGIKPAEAKYWDSKKISPIKATYENFIKELDKLIPVHARQLSIMKPYVEQPIHTKFVLEFKELTPSEDFNSFLDKDVEYVHGAMSAEHQDPKEFYKGYFESWEPIIRNLDASRDLTEAILTEIVIQDYYNNQEDGQWLILIKGYAGAGKSVLIKRLAWQAAIDFERFCIFYNKYSKIRYENIFELYKYAKQRIYIFVDNALSNEDDLIQLLDKSKKEHIPITVITTERVNIWNNENNSLKYFVKKEYQLEYLSKKEILELLSLLDRHKSLGYLEGKSQDERIRALSYKPGYELLVTLYEATQGKPYAEIINDEYLRIDGDKAKSLYLTVSILHRLNAPARAGLIARVHGISTEMFKKELYSPLEYIVFDRYDHRIQDYVYQTRHPYIAELLVETILVSQQDRFDEYIRIIRFLDVDF